MLSRGTMEPAQYHYLTTMAILNGSTLLQMEPKGTVATAT